MSKSVPLFARQPIFDTQKHVIAYELLFRNSEENDAGEFDGDHATSHVINQAFAERSLDEVVGDKKVFINFTRNLIISPPSLPKDRLVIEILEDVDADEEVLSSILKLKNAGYDIALDDFFINKNTKKLLSIANIIKIDVLALNKKQIEKYVTFLKPMKFTLLAEKVETHDMVEFCTELGFDWFQGYFFSKPEIIRGTKINEGKHAILQLMQKLNDPESTFDDLTKVISTDPKLSYKIIRIANSSAHGIPQEIDSLSKAVTMLGLDEIKNWATFLLLSNNDKKPEELCINSLTKAKLCELIGIHLGGKKLGEQCFTVGLLSSIDAFLDLSLEDAIKQLTLTLDIENAIIHHQGIMGSVLQNTTEYTRGNWKEIDWNFFEERKINEHELQKYYIESLSWAQSLLQGG